MTLAQYKLRLNSKLDEAKVLAERKSYYMDSDAHAILWHKEMIDITSAISDIERECAKSLPLSDTMTILDYALQINSKITELYVTNYNVTTAR